MAATQSRLLQYERKRATKTALLYVVLTALFLFLLTKYGSAAVTAVTGLFGREDQVIEENSALVPVPQMDILPEITNKQSLTVTGQAEPGGTLRFTLNGEKRDVLANSSGAYSTDFTLHDGDNTVRVQAVDSKGNTSREISAQVVLDTKEPNLTINTPSDTVSFKGKKEQNLTITGTTDPDAKITVNDRIAIVNTDGTFSITFSLNEGENQFSITATDEAGNQKQEAKTVTYSL